MDSSQPTQSILETLRTVEFRLGLKGYNVDEVDEYLEKAAVEAEAVQEQLRVAGERLQRANEKIAQLELELQQAPADRTLVDTVVREPLVTDETLQRTLLLAQKFVEQTKRESEAEAADVVSRAEERARNVLSQAEERARQLGTEAEQRLRDEVTRLESLRARLAGDIEAMARHLEEQRTRIRTSLTEALKWIDERVQPADSLVSVRGRDGDKTADAVAPNHPNGEGRPQGEGSRPAPPPAAGGAVPADGPALSGGPAERKAPVVEPRSGAPGPDRSQPPVGARMREAGPSAGAQDLFESGGPVD